MLGLIITLMIEFILKRQVCLYVSAFAIALVTPAFHGNWKLTPFYTQNCLAIKVSLFPAEGVFVTDRRICMQAGHILVGGTHVL